LETFSEERRVAWKHTPYSPGTFIDSQMCGPIPAVWDIVCVPTEWFVEEVRKVKVPHSSVVQICGSCGGRGRVACDSCNGTGSSHCPFCNHGYRMISSSSYPCSSCHATGRRDCIRCLSRGNLECTTCSGHGQLEWYLEARIDFRNEVANVVNIPGEARSPELAQRITHAAGDVIIQDEGVFVYPFPFEDANIAQLVASKVEQSRSQFPSRRNLRQRHSLRGIPICTTVYAWRGKENTFYVYGHDRSVYAPNYPQKCCCGCVIC